jgi:hypothetical protein
VEAFDVGEERAGRRRALVGVLLEAPRHDPREPLGHPGDEGRQGRRDVVQDRVERRVGARARERGAPGEQLEDEDAECEEVAPPVHRRAAHLLGAHVAERPHHVPRVRQRVRAARGVLARRRGRTTAGRSTAPGRSRRSSRSPASRRGRSRVSGRGGPAPSRAPRRARGGFRRPSRGRSRRRAARPPSGRGGASPRRRTPPRGSGSGSPSRRAARRGARRRRRRRGSRRCSGATAPRPPAPPRRNRCTARSSCISPGGSTFTATSRISRASRPR